LTTRIYRINQRSERNKNNILPKAGIYHLAALIPSNEYSFQAKKITELNLYIPLSKDQKRDIRPAFPDKQNGRQQTSRAQA